MKAVYRFIFCVSVGTFLCATAPVSAQSAAHWLGFTLKLEEHPWYFGVYGGYAHNTLYQGGAESHRPTQKWEGAGGWTIGLPVRYKVFNWLGVQAEPAFITKNYSFKRTGSVVIQGITTDFSEFGENTTTNGFLDFPVMVHLSAAFGGTGLNLFVNAGAFVGVWLYSTEKGRQHPLTVAIPEYGRTVSDVVDYEESYRFDDRKDNRFDGGLLFGAGLQFDFKAFSFFTEWRYSYSLSDMQKPYQKQNSSPKMNDTWAIQAGVLFKPGKLKRSHP
jgi:hypothetical protein